MKNVSYFTKNWQLPRMTLTSFSKYDELFSFEKITKDLEDIFNLLLHISNLMRLDYKTCGFPEFFNMPSTSAKCSLDSLLAMTIWKTP